MKHFWKINTFFFFFFLSACKEKKTDPPPIIISSFSFEGKIILIKDGDTYKITSNGKEKTIRLEHIDCPEKKQPYGDKAKQFAYDLCFGKTVVIRSSGKTDRNNRLIGEVILPDETNLNQEFVKQGLAWHFKRYSTDTVYARLEINAREKAIGLWSETNPIAPWLWRKM
mgnify:CR=1 FL=1